MTHRRHSKAEALHQCLEELDRQASIRSACDEPISEGCWAPYTLLSKLLWEANIVGYEPVDLQRVNRLAAIHNAEAAEGDKVDVNLLIATHRIRIVLGQAHLPWSVSMRLHEPGATYGSEERFLRSIYNEIHSDKVLRIPEDTARRLVETHKRVHEKTPPFGDWSDLDEKLQAWTLEHHQGRRWLRFELPSHADSIWDRWGVKCLALLWERLSNEFEQADSDLLLGWLIVADLFSRWTETPRELPQGFRTSLLDCAGELILKEDDLKDWDKELERLKLETDGVGGLGSPPLEAGASLLRQIHWWEDIDRYGLVDPERCRGSVASMIVMTVVNDDSGGPYTDRYARTKKLLKESSTRPFLGYEIVHLLTRIRRAAVAWLLLDAETSAIGLYVVDTMLIEERPDCGLYDSAHRRTATEQRRNAIWGSACGVWSELVRSSNDSDFPALVGEPHRYIATRLGDVRRRRLQDNSLLASALEQRLLVLEEFVDGRRGDDLPRNATRADERSEPWRSLLDFVEAVGVTRSPGAYADFPTSQLLALFWILRVASTQGSVELANQVAKEIVASYWAELWRLQQGGNEVRWLSDEAQVAELPWFDVAAVLHQSGETNTLLKTPSIDTIPTTDDELQMDRFGLANRLRLHLRVLLAIYNSLHQKIHRRAAVPTGLSDVVGAAIAEMLRLRATEHPWISTVNALDIEHEQPTFVAQEPLTPRVAAAIDQASPELRNDIIQSIRRDDPPLTVTLVLLSHVASESARDVLGEYVISLDVVDAIKDIHWIPHLSTLVNQALRSGLPDMAESIVLRVDSFGSKNPEWRQRSAEHKTSIAHARLFSHTDDDNAEMHSVPNEEQLEAQSPEDRALILMRNNPGESVLILRKLHASAPGRADLALNLFAAELMFAKTIENGEQQKQASQQAYTNWDEARRTLGASAYQRVQPTAERNCLLALEGAENDSEFETYWNSMEQAAQQRLENLRIRAAHLQRLGRTEDLVSLVSDITSYHSVGGILPRTAQELVEDVESGAWQGPADADFLGLDADAQVLPSIKQSYRQIMEQRPSELAKVVDTNLDRMLLDLLIDGARELRRRWVHLGQLAPLEEDKLNDLLVSLLRMRVSHYSWEVDDQTRQGPSGSGGSGSGRGGTGEIDWIIKGRQSNDIALFEAMVLGSCLTGYITKHIQKGSR